MIKVDWKIYWKYNKGIFVLALIFIFINGFSDILFGKITTVLGVSIISTISNVFALVCGIHSIINFTKKIVISGSKTEIEVKPEGKGNKVTTSRNKTNKTSSCFQKKPMDYI